jgi:hypothetical protein
MRGMGGLVDVETAALATGITPRAIRARIAAGHLTATKRGRCWYVSIAAIDLSNTTTRASRLGLMRHAAPAT